MAEAEELELVTTDVSSIPEIMTRVREGFRSHKTLSYDYRMQQLHNLQRLLVENEQRILGALKTDLNKCETEAILMEYTQVQIDLVDTLNNLSDWMSPCHKPRDLLNKFNSVYVQPDPYGVVLSIVPWNYPMQIMLCSLIGIIAAGNACVIKPSEYAVAYSNLMAELIPKYLDPECYAVVTGALEPSQALLKERFDFIMFTGSPVIGKIVMKNAAATLTPVLLELGGKSPVIVAKDANVKVAARRIMWGKCMNTGQTCIAPDYVLCMRDQKDKLVDELKKTVKEFYGENPKDSPDYGRIIQPRHFQRLVGLLEGTKGTVVYGGDKDPQTRYFQPTVVTDVAHDDKLMEEELFGPILPVLTVDSIDDAITFVNDREKPLAMYVFTESRATFERVSKLTTAGGVTHNDTFLHACVGNSLPFGGVGNSGCGSYHGKYSFDSFSHSKAVLCTGTGLEAVNSIRYPPFTSSKLKWIKWLFSKTEKKSGSSSWKIMLFLTVAMAAVLVQKYGLPSWLYPTS